MYLGRRIQINYPLEAYLIIEASSNDASFSISYWYQLSYEEKWFSSGERGNILIPLALLGVIAILVVGIYFVSVCLKQKKKNNKVNISNEIDVSATRKSPREISERSTGLTPRRNRIGRSESLTSPRNIIYSGYYTATELDELKFKFKFAQKKKSSSNDVDEAEKLYDDFMREVVEVDKADIEQNTERGDIPPRPTADFPRFDILDEMASGKSNLVQAPEPQLFFVPKTIRIDTDESEQLD